MIQIKNNLKRANAARIIFYLLVTISIISFYSHYLQYELLSNVKNGIAISPEAASSNDSRQAIISQINMIVLLASLVIFLMWVYRAYQNLYNLKYQELSCTPGWAIGYWFVPILSFFKPYVIMKEIWDGTQELSRTDNENPKIRRSHIIGLWWALYLISIASSYIVILAFGGKTTIDGLIDLTKALMVSNVFLIIVKVVTLIMINRIVIFEKELYEFVELRLQQQPSGAISGSVNVTGV